MIGAQKSILVGISLRANPNTFYKDIVFLSSLKGAEMVVQDT